MSLASVFDIAAMGMSVQTVRLNTTASNMANAETTASSEAEAYKARRPVFMAVNPSTGNDFANAFANDGGEASAFGVMVRDIVESESPVAKAYEPNNPMADEQGYVFYSRHRICRTPDAGYGLFLERVGLSRCCACTSSVLPQ